MSVVRYDTGRGQDYECSSGRYVLHSDCAALLARHNALREAAKKMLKPLSSAYIQCPLDVFDAYLAARAEVDKLLQEPI